MRTLRGWSASSSSQVWLQSTFRSAGFVFGPETCATPTSHGRQSHRHRPICPTTDEQFLDNAANAAKSKDNIAAVLKVKPKTPYGKLRQLLLILSTAMEIGDLPTTFEVSPCAFLLVALHIHSAR